MNRGIYAAASAMNAAQQRVDAISANLANAGAVGFKRKNVVTHSFENTLNKHMEPQIESKDSTDYSQGVLRSTGSEYDLGLEGRGFFAIDTESGEAYTRNGAFHVDLNGVLLTRDGAPVAWVGGRGTLNALGNPPTVDSEGTVRQDGNDIGRLKIVDFNDLAGLEIDRAGNLRADPTLRPQAAVGIVRQGFLENANVNAIDEMVGLIAAQRSFESSARTLSTIEQVMRRLTNSR